MLDANIIHREIEVIVETGKDSFSCFMSNKSDDLGFSLVGVGKTVKAAIAISMWNAMKCMKKLRELNMFKRVQSKSPDARAPGLLYVCTLIYLSQPLDHIGFGLVDGIFFKDCISWNTI